MPLQPTSASPQLRLADRDYVLRAAVLHQSNNGTLRGGHYSTVAKRGARWWVCNDTTVSELAAEPQETKLVTDSCYGVRLLFWQWACLRVNRQCLPRVAAAAAAIHPLRPCKP